MCYLIGYKNQLGYMVFVAEDPLANFLSISTNIFRFSSTVGSKTVAIYGYFALHAMWSLIAWESLLALAEWIEVFDLGFLLVF